MGVKSKKTIDQVQRDIDIRSRARDVVEQYYNLDISTPRRIREYVEARAMYSKLLRDNTSMTYSAIGSSIGKNHATILHIINQLEFDISNNVNLNSRYVHLNSIYQEYIQRDIDEGNAFIEISVSYEKLKESFKMLSKNYEMLMETHNKLIDEQSRRQKDFY